MELPESIRISIRGPTGGRLPNKYNQVSACDYILTRIVTLFNRVTFEGPRHSVGDRVALLYDTFLCAFEPQSILI